MNTSTARQTTDRPQPTRPTTSSVWNVVSPETSILAALDLSPRVLKLVLFLETLWRLKAYCWPSQEKLAKLLKVSVGTVPDILRAAKNEGAIHVIMNRTQKGQVVKRVGIIALRRLSNGPVATAETLASVEAEMRTERERRSKTFRLDQMPLFDQRKHQPAVSEPASERLAKSPTYPNKVVSLKKDDLEDDEFARENGDEDFPERNDQTIPSPIALPGPRPMLRLPAPAITPEPEAPQAASVLPDVDVKAMLWSWAAQHVAPAPRPAMPKIEAGLPSKPLSVIPPRPRRYRCPETPLAELERLAESDPIIAAELARRRAAQASAGAPPPAVPRSTRELLEKLPGSPPDWQTAAAEALVQDFGSEADRKLWSQLDKIAWLVWQRRIPVAPVLNAYDQAMRPEIRNRGAKFWAAFQGLTGLNAEAIAERTRL